MVIEVYAFVADPVAPARSKYCVEFTLHHIEGSLQPRKPRKLAGMEPALRWESREKCQGPNCASAILQIFNGTKSCTSHPDGPIAPRQGKGETPVDGEEMPETPLSVVVPRLESFLEVNPKLIIRHKGSLVFALAAMQESKLAFGLQKDGG